MDLDHFVEAAVVDITSYQLVNYEKYQDWLQETLC